MTITFNDYIEFEWLPYIITDGPSVSDSMDFSPIILHGISERPIFLCAFHWWVRLAIWAIRRYVRSRT